MGRAMALVPYSSPQRPLRQVWLFTGKHALRLTSPTCSTPSQMFVRVRLNTNAFAKSLMLETLHSRLLPGRQGAAEAGHA